MNPLSTHNLYKNVFDGSQDDDAISAVIMAADFPNIQFTLHFDDASDFQILAFKSNQQAINGVMNPPDITQPSGPDNDYEQIMYTAEPGGVNYDTDNPFNPTGLSAGSQSFVMQTQGAIWVFLAIENVAGGALLAADINLFNQ